MKVSASNIYQDIHDSYHQSISNIDDTYGVVNFKHLLDKSTPKKDSTVLDTYNDHMEYIMACLKSKEIDSDEYNLLKELKLKCFNTYLSEYSYADSKTISIETYNAIKQIDTIDNSDCVYEMVSGDMHKYDKHIKSDDTAFVIFANKRLGGLVLTSGCAQEEIAYMQYPELLYLKIKQMELGDDDVVYMSNLKKYNALCGYGFDVEQDTNGTTGTTQNFILMDAIQYQNKKDQFIISNVKQEIKKCMIAFSNVPNKNIITSNWGCGAFKGDPYVKYMIQMYCAKASNKSLWYFSPASELMMVHKYYATCGSDQIHQDLFHYLDRYNTYN